MAHLLLLLFLALLKFSLTLVFLKTWKNNPIHFCVSSVFLYFRHTSMCVPSPPKGLSTKTLTARLHRPLSLFFAPQTPQTHPDVLNDVRNKETKKQQLRPFSFLPFSSPRTKIPTTHILHSNCNWGRRRLPAFSSKNKPKKI